MKTQYELMEQSFLVWFVHHLVILEGVRPFITAIGAAEDPESEFIRRHTAQFDCDWSAPGLLLCAEGSPPIWIDIRSKFNTISEHELRTQNHLVELGNIVIQANSAAEAIADLRTMGALVILPHMPLVAVPEQNASRDAHAAAISKTCAGTLVGQPDPREGVCNGQE